MEEHHHPFLSYLPESVETGPANMAIDMGMLRVCAGGGSTFRSYGWQEPTITFGLSQRFVDVRSLFAAEAAGLCFVRRPTGGGVVDHRGDWTYALALSADVGLAQLVPVEIYREIHACVAGVIGDLGGRAVALAPCPRLCEERAEPTQAVAVCFEEPVADDVVLSGGGAKVAGAAMKRTREGVLIQGSIRPRRVFGDDPGEGARRDFFNAFAAALAGLLGVGWTIERRGELCAVTTETAFLQDRECFASEGWTKRR